MLWFLRRFLEAVILQLDEYFGHRTVSGSLRITVLILRCLQLVGQLELQLQLSELTRAPALGRHCNTTNTPNVTAKKYVCILYVNMQ
mmetsp:Transcript_101584/g.296133  ORF Transcript_101584/g.296133 Transcript_101584/m.296133 type:complete len:87 (+) Transcript_101584:1638-1898(+)